MDLQHKKDLLLILRDLLLTNDIHNIRSIYSELLKNKQQGNTVVVKSDQYKAFDNMASNVKKYEEDLFDNYMTVENVKEPDPKKIMGMSIDSILQKMDL